MMPSSKLLFDLGFTCVTPGALRALDKADQSPFELLLRHQSGDWGDLDDEDKSLNDQALKYGSRIFSAYYLHTQVKVWVITEWDHSLTTVLLPSEY